MLMRVHQTHSIESGYWFWKKYYDIQYMAFKSIFISNQHLYENIMRLSFTMFTSSSIVKSYSESHLAFFWIIVSCHETAQNQTFIVKVSFANLSIGIFISDFLLIDHFSDLANTFNCCTHISHFCWRVIFSS